MKYLILIYNNAQSRQVWDEMSERERTEGVQAYVELDAALAASGELLASESLDDPATTTQVAVKDGRTLTTDGPFAEVKEQLAGFYLLECDSAERAVEIAAQIPEIGFATIEVRPVRDLSGYGM